jgi:ribosomal protein L32
MKRGVCSTRRIGASTCPSCGSYKLKPCITKTLWGLVDVQLPSTHAEYAPSSHSTSHIEENLVNTVYYRYSIQPKPRSGQFTTVINAPLCSTTGNYKDAVVRPSKGHLFIVSLLSFQDEILLPISDLPPSCYWLWPGSMRHRLSSCLQESSGRRGCTMGFQELVCGSLLQHSSQRNWSEARRLAAMGGSSTKRRQLELYSARRNVHLEVPLHDRGHRSEANSSKRLCAVALQQA